MIGARASPKTLVKIENGQLLIVLDFLAINLRMNCSSSMLTGIFTWLYPALDCTTVSLLAGCSSSQVEPMPMALWAPQISPFREKCPLC